MYWENEILVNQTRSDAITDYYYGDGNDNNTFYILYSTK